MQLNDEPRFREVRAKMVAEQLRARGVHDERVLAAMSVIPRHVFVAQRFWGEAYDDTPLAIAESQSISQPYIVAVMLEALGIEEHHNVLEVGTGTGYQAALLSRLAARVHTIERYPSLGAEARHNLRLQGIENVTVHVGDGTLGLSECAPFDRIIVSAAAPAVPDELFRQLTEEGRMIIPVGDAQGQYLNLVIKTGKTQQIRMLDACRFVPLIGEAGYR